MPLRSAIDDAYLAGFLDGEGSFQFVMMKRGDKNYVEMRICVSNTDRRVLVWVRRNYGGRLYTFVQTSMRRGTGNQKPIHRLDWTGVACGRVLDAVLPYLRIKRRQGRLMARAYALRRFTERDRKPYQRRPAAAVVFMAAARVKMMAMNKRGVA